MPILRRIAPKIGIIISDHQAIMEDYVSITPLQRDQTDYAAVQSLLQEAASGSISADSAARDWG